MKAMRQKTCQQSKGSVLGKDCSKLGVLGCLREMNKCIEMKFANGFRLFWWIGFGRLCQVTLVVSCAVDS